MSYSRQTCSRASIAFGLAESLCILTHQRSCSGSAAQDGAADEPPEPPEIADTGAAGARGEAARGGEAIGPPPAPRLYRRQEHGQTITEYSRGGKVFLMTVKPRVGPTQYWDDPDGDGQFQRSTSDDIDESPNLPKWRLGGW